MARGESQARKLRRKQVHHCGTEDRQHQSEVLASGRYCRFASDLGHIPLGSRPSAGDRELTARQAPTRHRLPTRYRPRNVFLGEFKTSVRLPPVMWEALEDIARHHGATLQDLIRQIDRDREQGQGLTDAIRIYIVEFYRARIKL